MKKQMTIVAAGLAVAVMAGSMAEAASMVQYAQQLAAMKRMMDAQLNAAPVRARNIVNYALGKKGQKVGNGQCTELVNGALAASNSRAGNFADAKNYNWGMQRSAGSPIACGDIIQFEDATFTTTTRYNEGRTSTRTENFPHHTAIVRFVRGKVVVLLHQNLDGSPVKETVLNLADLKAGRYTVWVAVAK